MGKQHDSGAAPLALTRAVQRWDFDESVKKMRGIAKQWNKLTLEVVRELYLAKEYLTNQKGQRHNPNAPDFILYTWESYCKTIEFSRQQADYYIKKFIPKELSDNGRNVLLLEPPMVTESTADRALMDARMEKVLRGEERPKDWTDKEEAELKKRHEEARFRKMAEELNVPAIARTKKDYFEETLKHSKDIVNFKLEDRGQIMAQAAIFEHIEAYLRAFTNIETKALAAFNLALKTKNLANDIAETNFQLSEAKETKHDS